MRLSVSGQFQFALSGREHGRVACDDIGLALLAGLLHRADEFVVPSVDMGGVGVLRAGKNRRVARPEVLNRRCFAEPASGVGRQIDHGQFTVIAPFDQPLLVVTCPTACLSGLAGADDEVAGQFDHHHRGQQQFQLPGDAVVEQSFGSGQE